MRGVAVSVESIRWPLIYVIVVEHVPKHDLIFFQADYICKEKLNIFRFISSHQVRFRSTEAHYEFQP